MTNNKTLGFIRNIAAITALVLCVSGTAVAYTTNMPEPAIAVGPKHIQYTVPSVTAAVPASKAGVKHKKTLTGKANLNNATAKQLALLPGIGPKKAERIVAFRARRRFQRVQDLRRVKGFGYKALKRLKPYLSVSGESTLRLQ